MAAQGEKKRSRVMEIYYIPLKRFGKGCQ